MATFSTSEFKSGLKVMLDADPCAIIENEFVKPGKGQAFNRVKIRNLKTGRVIERTFKSGETLEAADVVDTDMQFLYNDGEFYHFMVPDTFEQFAASPANVGDVAKWLKGQEMCVVTLWNGQPLLVAPPLPVGFCAPLDVQASNKHDATASEQLRATLICQPPSSGLPPKDTTSRDFAFSVPSFPSAPSLSLLHPTIQRA